ncbi:MAG: cytochrome bd-I oxidase subunit CydX [Stutzerimonas stutzeri]|nr:MAG: cytochrome bd-I oxidase subunit CydX [Stutzerimonas stutzeri]
MWYFAWILGLPLAAAFAVLNAMWYELIDDKAKNERSSRPSDGARTIP